MPLPASAPGWFRAPVAAKVPAITALFWLVKVLTTGIGESLSDYLASVSIPLAAAVGVGGFGVAMLIQFHTRRYAAVAYWLTVGMVAVFGTMVADGVHLIGLPYAETTALYLLVVAALFVWWYLSEGTLSIHSITTRRRETFYWATVLATFALGTAAGDLTSDQLRLGYLDSALLFGAAIVVPALAWRFLRLNPVIAFWLAYVMTRPLGASIADWLGKPVIREGLGWGDGTVSAVGGTMIVLLVSYVALRRRDIQQPQVEPAATRLSEEPTTTAVAISEA
jgi:uncharacterized membrane-anchored protein